MKLKLLIKNDLSKIILKYLTKPK